MQGLTECCAPWFFSQTLRTNALTTCIPGWPRGGTPTNPWFSAAAAFLRMTPRPKGGGGLGGQQDEDDGGFGDGKGPKSFFRLRVVPCRKLVALVAVGLCVLAGESYSSAALYEATMCQVIYFYLCLFSLGLFEVLDLCALVFCTVRCGGIGLWSRVSGRVIQEERSHACCCAVLLLRSSVAASDSLSSVIPYSARWCDTVPCDDACEQVGEGCSGFHQSKRGMKAAPLNFGGCRGDTARARYSPPKRW